MQLIRRFRWHVIPNRNVCFSGIRTQEPLRHVKVFKGSVKLTQKCVCNGFSIFKWIHKWIFFQGDDSSARRHHTNRYTRGRGYVSAATGILETGWRHTKLHSKYRHARDESRKVLINDFQPNNLYLESVLPTIDRIRKSHESATLWRLSLKLRQKSKGCYT